MRLSQKLWSWIQHTLHVSTELTFSNCPAPDGADVWRRLVVAVILRSITRRFALRDKVQRSGMSASTSFEGVDAQSFLGDKDLTAYQAAGGTELTDEDKRHVPPRRSSLPASARR